MLSLQKIKEVGIPKNTNKLNNLSLTPAAVYNDSVNLYDAVITILNTSTLSPVGFVINQYTNTVDLVVAGNPYTINAANTALAGVMTSTQVNNLNTLRILTGTNPGDVSFGNSITGNIIPASSNILGAFQAVSNAITNLISNPPGNGIYGGTGTIPDTTIATTVGTFFLQTPTTGSRVTIGDRNGIAGGLNIDLRPGTDIFIGKNNSSADRTTPYLLITDDSTTLKHTGGDELIFTNSGLINSCLNVRLQFKVKGISSLFQGLVYDTNYSANFVNRSLVDKEYVDNLVNNINTLNNSIYTSSGLVPANVTATQQGAFTISNQNLHTTFIGSGAGNRISLSPTNITIGNPGTANGTIYTTSNGVILQGNSSLLGTPSTLTLGSTGGGNLSLTGQFLITNTTGAGIEYGANYNTTFTNRSLVDKAYVDSKIGVNTDLTTVYFTDKVTVESSSGGDTDINAASTTQAGVMTSTQVTTLNNVYTAVGAGVSNTMGIVSSPEQLLTNDVSARNLFTQIDGYLKVNIPSQLSYLRQAGLEVLGQSKDTKGVIHKILRIEPLPNTTVTIDIDGTVSNIYGQQFTIYGKIGTAGTITFNMSTGEDLIVFKNGVVTSAPTINTYSVNTPNRYYKFDIVVTPGVVYLTELA